MTLRFDVAVVGAGTAGAATAALCAQRGLSVVCLDRRPLDESGARWLNGVPFSSFDLAGIPRPEGDELAGSGHGFTLVAGWNGPSLSFTRDSVPEVDMRLLVARLQGMAQAAGAELWGDCKVKGFTEVPACCQLSTSRGAVEARWLIDASGLAGARLLGQGRVHGRDLCVAAQQVRHLIDPVAARRFFEGLGTEPGTTLSFAGVAGGFSVVNVWVGSDRLGLLTGSIPADGHPSGLSLLEEFAKQYPWVGETIFGGSRAIPLCRPLWRLCRGRVAAVGDAARQVFPAHGSGIGAGLVAAAVLAESLADGSGVAGYNLRWQREHGGLLAAYDLFRRHSQGLAEGEMEQMMAAGLLDPASVSAAMEQRLPSLNLSGLLSKARGVLLAPRAVAGILPVFMKMAAVLSLYARYPEGVDAQRRWAKSVSRVFSEGAVAEFDDEQRLTAAGGGDSSRV
jgi:menaquinone-9 beta-reductase